MKSIEFGCSKCDRMFNSMEELAAHVKEHDKQQPPITPNTILTRPDSTIVPKTAPSLPPMKASARLTYVYKGGCSCGGSLMTLEIDVEAVKGAGKHFVVAICSLCKRQIETREVAKL